MKKTLKTICLLGASAMTLALAACGGDSSNKITIDFWHTFGDKVETALQAQVDRFAELVKANEGVDVEVKLTYKGGYNDMPQQVKTALAGGDSPTIAVAYPDHVADYIQSEGGTAGKYVVNLQDFIDDSTATFGTDTYLGDTEAIDDFVPAFIDEGRGYTRDGMYSLPYMKSTEVMFYNMDIVKRALPFYNATYYGPAHGGAELAEGQLAGYFNDITWDDLMDYAQVIKDHQSTIADELDVPVLYDSDSNLFISKLYQNGIGYSSINPTTKKGVIDFESGEARTEAEALVSKWQQECQAGLLTTKGVKGEYGSNYFKNEQTVFTVGSSGGSGYTFPEAGSFEVGIARVPTDNVSNAQYVTQGPTLTMLTHPRYSETKATQIKKYAWKLLKFLTSKNVNVELTCNGSEGYLPVRNSCYTTEVFYDYIENGGDYAKVAQTVQDEIAGAYLNTAVFPGSATLRTQCGGIVTNVLKLGANVTSTFDAAIAATKLDIA
ncbi:MAG TPA: extracellular solute-binding protein [Bacilli bacterium]|nr:extracellular solute-binding protein [Bacilli bacterium]HPS18858.1 extracellular solute-binding protein [Bacilli bacterium]